MFQAALADRADGSDGRPVRTSLRRGPRAAAIVCGACGNWLAVGYDPQEDAAVLDLLIRCNACRSVNDPLAATRLPDAAAGGRRPPAALHATEYWARGAVERVHSLAEQERRWPWKPAAGGRAS